MDNKKKNSRRKIVAFMNSFSHGSSGSDIVCVEIVKRLIGYKKLVITSKLGVQLAKKNKLDASFLVTTREKAFRFIIPTYLIRIVKAIFLKIQLEEGDVLLGSSDFPTDVIPIFLLKIKNRKVLWIQHIHHLIPKDRKLPYLAQRISFQLIKRFADVVVVVNSQLGKNLQEMGFRGNKINVNHNGSRLEVIKKVDQDKKGKYDGVFMARLKKHKGIFDLIEIWEKVVEKIPSAKLGIIGKGNPGTTKELQRLLSEKNITDKVEILGFLSNTKAFNTIKSSKVFLFPSHEEGFGLVGVESQALGTPVVAWNLPAFMDSFPKGMVKIPFGNHTQFSDEVVKLLKNENYYKKLQKEAFENASSFSWENTASRELGYINEFYEGK